MKIFKNYLYNMSYQIIAVILPLITVPYISRVLGAEAVGINSYTNAIITYFVLIANVGITVYGNRTISYTRDSIEERSRKFWEIVIVKLIMGTISFVLLFIFIGLYGRYSEYLMWQSIQILAAIIDISWFFVGLEDFKKTVSRNIIVKVLSASLILTLVKKPSDLALYIIIVAGATFLGNLTLWTYLKKLLVPVKRADLSLLEHMGPIFVLFIPQLASQLFMTINKLLLGNLSTITQIGYFDNSDKVVRILLTAITAVGTVVFPRLANSFKTGKKDKVEKYLKFSFDAVNLISFPIVAGVIIISKPFSMIYFGSEFKGINVVLATLVVELIFMGWSTVMGNQYLVAINRTKGLTISVIVATVILLISSYLILPTYGAQGAAITSVLGEFIIATVQLLYVRKYINLFYIFKDISKYLFASVVMFIICYLTPSLSSNFITMFIKVIIGAVVYVVIILLLKPDLVKDISGKVLEKLNFKHNQKL